ncbi:hypothetical protein GCM10028819_24670 [Spirosoma humi]
MFIGKTIIGLLLLCVAVSSCNPVTDSQPAPQDDEVPSSAIQAVTEQFPQADEMIFKTVQKNQVWQVSFSQKATRYSAAANTQRLLVAYQTENRSVPDSLSSLVRNTVIDGGTFSNLRVQNYSWFKDDSNNGLFVFADYDWLGNRYTFRWTITTINATTTYVTELFPYYQLEYRTTTLADLPAIIQESITRQPGEFSFATVQLDLQGKKRYAISLKQSSSTRQLQYTDEGVLISVYDPGQLQSLSALTQLPMPIQTYIQHTPELAGFGLGGQFTMLAKTSYNQLETYQVTLQKGKQTWFMLFNGQGELLKRTYLNLV